MNKILRAAALLVIGASPVQHLGAQSPALSADFGAEGRLKTLVDRAAQAALDAFRASQLLPAQLALTLVDLRDPAHPVRASVRGDVPIYPASVIKLFYLTAAHRWLRTASSPTPPSCAARCTT